jgi:dolichol-phosphate mannosyltransferase
MFNEENAAETCVRRVCAALEAIPYPNRLIVVDDGSRDRTAEILTVLEGSLPRLRVVRHARNAGYGAALRTAVGQARRDGYDYALFMDSDLTNDPADIARFVQKMEQGIDVIKASRYVAGGGMAGVPRNRRWISRAGNTVARFLYGMSLKDCTNGFRAVKVSILARMQLAENGFPIIMEELYHCKFLAKTWCEIPVVLTSRNDQRGTSFSYRPETFKKYLQFGLRAFFCIRPAVREGEVK